MENFIIGLLMLVVVIFAIRGSVKHFRGEGGCCGGSSAAKPAKKKLKGKVMQTYLLTIEGMHCQNCAYNVERAINDLDGAAAKVNLKKHEAKVSCDRALAPELIKRAVEAKGYTVAAMKGGSLYEG